MVITRPATVEDAIALSGNLREEDAREIECGIGLPPDVVLIVSVESSDEAWTTEFDGEIGCIWGVCNSGPGILAGRVGAVWMLSSPVVDRNKKSFWRESKRAISELLNRWDLLWNDVDARYEKAVRWAIRLGFRFEEPRPYGFNGEPFRRFEVSAEDLPWDSYQQSLR